MGAGILGRVFPGGGMSKLFGDRGTTPISPSREDSDMSRQILHIKYEFIILKYHKTI